MNSRPMTENDFNPDVLNDIKNSIDWAEEKGLIKGREEGRKEEKLSLARNLLLKGMVIDIIQEITGLSLEEISKLQDEL